MLATELIDQIKTVTDFEVIDDNTGEIISEHVMLIEITRDNILTLFDTERMNDVHGTIKIDDVTRAKVGKLYFRN